MSTPAGNERVKASRLRKKRDAGKPLDDADRIWLAEYQRRQVPRKQAVPPGTAIVSYTRQREIPGTSSPTGRHVQTTTPAKGHIDPTAHVWSPTVPAAPEGAPPPAPGAPPRPVAGTPIVDATTAQQPAGDPAAAQQFAAFVMFVTGLGMQAARELVADELASAPAQLRAFLDAEDVQKQTLATVGAAAERVAMKYGFKSVPLGDEAIVVGALAGSGVAILKNAQRKKLSKKGDAATSAKTPDPKLPKNPLGDLWREGLK